MGNHHRKSPTCPLLRKPCIEHQCAWFIQIRGQHPQTGESIDQHDCSMVIQPLLLIENSAQQRSTGAAIESFRNEMVAANESTQALMTNTPLIHKSKRTI